MKQKPRLLASPPHQKIKAKAKTLIRSSIPPSLISSVLIIVAAIVVAVPLVLIFVLRLQLHVSDSLSTLVYLLDLALFIT
jgi:hypothetical protein